MCPLWFIGVSFWIFIFRTCDLHRIDIQVHPQGFEFGIGNYLVGDLAQDILGAFGGGFILYFQQDMLDVHVLYP